MKNPIRQLYRNWCKLENNKKGELTEEEIEFWKNVKIDIPDSIPINPNEPIIIDMKFEESNSEHIL